jgi:uncharacterized protein YbjQ (UPF0145 family)
MFAFRPFAALLGALLLAAGAAAPAAAQTTPPVRVYDASELVHGRYTVLKRLWVESWRSAFRLTEYGEPGAAIAALVDEAGRLGADGVANLYCLDASHRLSRSDYFCYGNAIKLQ